MKSFGEIFQLKLRKCIGHQSEKYSRLHVQWSITLDYMEKASCKSIESGMKPGNLSWGANHARGGDLCRMDRAGRTKWWKREKDITHMISPCPCREWQMERAFQTALWVLKPEIIFILGDIFDEGKWSSAKVYQHACIFLQTLDNGTEQNRRDSNQYLIGR